jgi:site-specific DNA-cytosine methylase
MPRASQLSVGDLYCGAGGFSEGFRQAGFDIKWAIDNWAPAVTTFQKNFPKAKAMSRDMLDEDGIGDLEHVDVLVGGPPCTHFSLANRGGNGDLKLGLRMVAKFLDAVDAIKPDYWIMENVPNLEAILRRPSDVGKSLSKEHLDRYLTGARVFHAQDFGVPQSRRRLFSGNFPDPVPLPGGVLPMKKVILGLPSPLQAEGEPLQRIVHDPLYDEVILPRSKLTDHFYSTALSSAQVEMARTWKEHHPWYGKMQFPDSMDRPSRTIAATATKSSRASIIIKDERIGGKYRVPTLRECASLQGFPISYQFWASGPSDKQRLIGNAVPPPLARAFAVAIAAKEGMKPPSRIECPLGELPEQSFRKNPTPRQYTFPILRRYRNFVRGTLADCRVELDNKGPASRYPIGEGNHLVGWRTILVLGYARDYAAFQVDVDTAQAIAEIVSHSTLDQIVESTRQTALSQFEGEVPDASSLQAKWARKTSFPKDPDWILQKASQVARKVAGAPRRRKEGPTGSEIAALLKGRMIAHGDDIQKARWQDEVVDSYSASSLLSLSMAVELANQGKEWLKKNWEQRFVPVGTTEGILAPVSVDSSDKGLFLPLAKSR